MAKTLMVPARPAWVEARRTNMQNAYDHAIRKRTINTLPFVPLVPIYILIWCLVQPQGPINVALAFGLLITAVTSGVAISVLKDLSEERKRKVFVLSETGNDPAGIIPAIDDLIMTVRNPDADQRRLLGSYENAVDRMQAMIPDHPLAQLVAYGYWPSRPEQTVNERSYTVDYDSEDDQKHWERALKALESLRTLLRTEDPITIDEVVKAIGKLVPPLRAVLRYRNVPTWRIERIPPKTIAVTKAIASGAIQSSAPLTLPEQEPSSPTMVPTPTRPEPEPDAITPVDDRLNATANMTAMTLRSMMTAFRSANPSLFQGDDLQTAERMLDDHLPRLVDAFIVADDASEGEQRDEARANFAKSLGFIRDSMGGIMERHARSARQLLEMESRFIETSHGPGDPRLAP